MSVKTGRDYTAQFLTREDGGKRYIEGYFVRFDDHYELWSDNYETISPHAFDDTMNRDIVCLWNHDSNYPMGRISNGMLTLRVDSIGVYGVVEVNENDRFAVDCYERVKRGDVMQCSFGFDIVEESTIQHTDGSTEFRIEKVVLYEVSPVTFPAYKETSITARKAAFEEIERRKLKETKNQLKERLHRIVKNHQTA